MFSKISPCLLLSILLSFAAFAQPEKDIRVSGKFLLDSIKIGEPIPYCLSVYYPASANVVLPDSTYSFAPFEFQNKKYFQTKTVNNISYDSVVYFLTTFEIDSIQRLKLPVFEIHKKDCTAVFAQEDGIILKQLVKQKLDSIEAPALPLKTNTAYQNVKWLLDYPFFLALGGVLLVVLMIAWLIFGKRIRKYFRARKLSKNHEAFLNKFTSSVSQLSADFSLHKAETTALLWKNYLERLTSTPYTKYTSKEILLHEKDEQLGPALQAIDRMVYGGSAHSMESFDVLRSFANTQFNKKLNEVNRG